MSCEGEGEDTFYTEANDSKRTLDTSTTGSYLNESAKPEDQDSGTTMSDSSFDSDKIRQSKNALRNHRIYHDDTMDSTTTNSTRDTTATTSSENGDEVNSEEQTDRSNMIVDDENEGESNGTEDKREELNDSTNIIDDDDESNFQSSDQHVESAEEEDNTKATTTITNQTESFQTSFARAEEEQHKQELSATQASEPAQAHHNNWEENCKIEITRVKTLSYRLKPFLKSALLIAMKLTVTFLYTLWIFFSEVLSFIFKRQKSIRNQVVLITGSAGYLGQQLACEFSKQGVTLLLWDIDEEANKKTYDALRALGHRRMYMYKVDLSDENDVRENAKKVLAKHGFVSMVVLAAGTSCDLATLQEKNTQDISDSFKLFYQSNLWMYQEFLPQMEERNSGHFVVISSQSIFLSLPQISTYTCLKAAQAKLLETIDTDLNLKNNLNRIKTSVVYLGGLNGGIAQKMTEAMDKFTKTSNSLSIDADRAAKYIVNGVIYERKAIYAPFYVYIVYLLSTLLPKRCFETLIFMIMQITTTTTTVAVETETKKND